VVLVWWFLHGLDLRAVLARIQQIRVPYLVGAVALSLGGMIVRSRRWQYFLAPLKRVPLSSAAAAVFEGWTITAVLPGRLGEAARAVLLGRRESLRVSAVFGTVVLERLLDALVVVLLLVGYLALQPTSLAGAPGLLATTLRTGAVLSAAALATIGGLVAFAHRLPPGLRDVLQHSIARLPGPLGRRGWTLLTSFGGGLSASLRPADDKHATTRLRFGIVAETALLWTATLGTHACLLNAFDVQASLLKLAPLLFLITLGISVPTPAAIGSYHTAVQFGITALMGASGDTAAGYAIVSHAVAFVPSVSIGAVLLARERLTLADVLGTGV
jgi:uncharacterized membrane protein YbhN (UPF0104 family)